MPNARFGDLPGITPGATFPDRMALSRAGVHRAPQAGISGRGAEGAESIVLNEGYADDEDFGDEIIYTGEGGRDPNTGVLIADQQLKRGNLALVFSHTQGLPVRVIRGPRLKSPYAPASGYRYDGLYAVEDHWQDRGRAGFLIWRFRLRRTQGQPVIAGAPTPNAAPLGSPTPGRQAATIQRIVRNTAVSQHVKTLHDFHCQFCGIRLETPSGPYAEGAHIQPLGRPHNGPDVPENVLCVCANCHVLFDSGAIAIADDLTLIGAIGGLRTHANHRVSVTHIRYHRQHYAQPSSSATPP